MFAYCHLPNFKGLIFILNEVNEKVKGGLVSSRKAANFWQWISWATSLLLHSKMLSVTVQPHLLKEVSTPQPCYYTSPFTNN